MIPVDGIENFPLMGRAIFQKAAKRGDFFQKQVIFRSPWARLMAGRSKHVRYDIDGGDMLAYGLHSGSLLFRHINHDGISIQIKRRGSEDTERSSVISASAMVAHFASRLAPRSRANILGVDRNPHCHPGEVGCLRPRSSGIDLPSSSYDSR
jgi:hypothetical protein